MWKRSEIHSKRQQNVLPDKWTRSPSWHHAHYYDMQKCYLLMGDNSRRNTLREVRKKARIKSICKHILTNTGRCSFADFFMLISHWLHMNSYWFLLCAPTSCASFSRPLGPKGTSCSSESCWGPDVMTYSCSPAICSVTGHNWWADEIIQEKEYCKAFAWCIN